MSHKPNTGRSPSIKQVAEDSSRLRLIHEVYETVFRATECFGDGLGCELAYLLGAIATTSEGAGVTWGRQTHRDHIELFHTLFSADHAVWQFIDIPTEE